MKEKIFSFLKREIFVLPLKLRYILRTFSLWEKITFLFSVLLLIFGGLWFLKMADQSLTVEIPKAGGNLKEGIIGTPRFINPLLAISDADRDLTNLVYSGLMRADGKGELIPDLAERYEVAGDGLSYTFFLKSDINWPDKKPLTSDDIVFTIQMAKNPILKSNQRASWEGVEIERIDEKTIRFFLKRPYAPFLENTTLGILPKHIWEKIPPEQMALTDFNIKPIGSGPYQVSKIFKDSTGIIQSYILEPNKKFILGKPYIANLTLKFYPSEEKLIDAYENGEIESIGGISPQSALKIKRDKTSLKTLLLPRVFAVFFNQNNASLLANKEVRQALDLTIDKQKIVNDVLHNFGMVLNHPLPPGSLGAIDKDEIQQYSAEKNLKKAAGILEKAGWFLNAKDKIFEKKEKKKETIKLEFELSTSNAPELTQAAELIKTMWEELGAKINLKIFEMGDLNQNAIRPRKYDALLFGLMMGRDPDPFAFWHSSQRNDPGLNISLYANIAADKLLEEARAISDSQKRKEKYEAFEEQVEHDIPAVFLYSPEYIYLMPGALRGFDTDTITIPPERFTQVYNWYIETEKVWPR